MLSTFWHDWGSAVEWAVAAIGGWWAKAAANRIQTQRNAIDATKAETEQMKLSLDRERSLTERVLQYAAETQESWRILYQREAVLIEYHAAAIGARLRVHELEAQKGLPPTKFDPLPGYPPVSDGPRNTLLTLPDAAAVAGDQAASTADPGADTPTGTPAPPTTAAAERGFNQ
ncbi:hypothetical protein [Gluconobacter morbifer]|uniref:Uncharacterized protein n=1 Tax=Gluconobacter morbifer G707 TaxID=1088869 RepID=G6XKV4_9PROT|nr:hypothetical protein [Gluconobacter morbifer]EHH67667.1 hypothetical protein GMO_21200 [Gluconobacter morbifer G707]